MNNGAILTEPLLKILRCGVVPKSLSEECRYLAEAIHAYSDGKEPKQMTKDALMEELLCVLRRNDTVAFLRKVLTRALILEKLEKAHG